MYERRFGLSPNDPYVGLGLFECVSTARGVGFLVLAKNHLDYELVPEYRLTYGPALVFGTLSWCLCGCCHSTVVVSVVVIASHYIYSALLSYRYVLAVLQTLFAQAVGNVKG